MADWNDVMRARADADAEAASARRLAGARNGGSLTLAMLAVAMEVRALATLIDFARGDAR